MEAKQNMGIITSHSHVHIHSHVGIFGAPKKLLVHLFILGSLTGLLCLNLDPAWGLPLKAKSNYILCKNRKVVRSIRVLDAKGEGGTCKTIYTKWGLDKVVGTGRNVRSCFNYMNNIQHNLEKGRWKCKNVSHAIIIEGTQWNPFEDEELAFE